MNTIKMQNENVAGGVLENFNKTNEQYKHTIISWFEEQADKTPDKTAVRIQNTEISYKELNRRANYIGKLLLDDGIKKGDVIAIMTGRSIELIVGILGVLKSGAAFLPVDVNNPQERIRFMLEDSGAKGVICGVNNWDSVKKLTRRKVYVSTENKINIYNPGVDIQPDNLAYIIYTSGTTGRPKGVMLENQGLVNFINWSYKEGRFKEDSVVLQKATCSFDASLYEIFLALLSGSCLQLLTEEENDDFDRILSVIKLNKVTHLVMIPTILSALLDHMRDNDIEDCFMNIQRLYIAGETLSIDLLNKYSEVTGHGWEYISNLYGPTEGSICATGFNISDLNNSELIPIGKPIDNVKVYIMNGTKLCGIEEEGELCIGGVGVGRGYINRDELTKEKFINNPYVEGEKVYRSGDLAKWDKAGNIIFLGRIDEQIKLNGLRIELGEIKNRLVELAEIVAAAVVVKEMNGGKHLVAYIVSSQEIDETYIKLQLGKTLPDYMIPGYIVKIDCLPITANGKLDQKALPDIEFNTNKEYKAPKTEAEKDLIILLEVILGIKGIGSSHDFFELGGDSIKAIRIVSKLRSLGYAADLQTIMKERQVEKIAAKLVRNVKGRGHAQPVEGEVLLTPIQSYFFRSNLEEPNHFNQSFLLFGRDIQEAHLRRAVQALVRHHDMLRAVYCGDKQFVRPEDEEAYEFDVKKLSGELTKEEIMRQIAEHEGYVQRSMDLQNGPLVKVCLYKCSQISYVLFAVHHLIVDGISWRILVEDLNSAYDYSVQNKKIQLPEKTDSYKEWSTLLQEYGRRHEIKDEFGYWHRIEEIIKEEVKPLFQKGVYGKREKETVRFDESFTKRLLLDSGRAYCTEINDLLVTALFRTLANITGGETVTFNLEGHGREAIHVPVEIDRTVGWFTTVYPIVGQGVGRSMEEDIIATKEMIRKIPNKGLGYGLLKAQGELGEYYNGELTFNYLGDFGKETDNYTMGIHTIEYGDQVSVKNHFASPVSIDCSVIEGRLETVITYDETYCSNAVIARLRDEFINSLEQIVAYCVNCTGIRHTASDYGEKNWSDKEFRHVEEMYKTKGQVIERIMPLTPMQEGLLFEEMSCMKKTSYVVQVAYAAEHAISEPVFKESVKLLLKKYSALRTRIVHRGVDEPRQIILKQSLSDYELHDLSTAQNPECEIHKICESDIERGFDLERDQLFRVKYIQLAGKKAKIIFCFHHIIMDGWSMSILLNDLGRFYEKLCDEMDSEAIFEREETETRVDQLLKYEYTEEGLEFWRDMLEDFTVRSEIRPEGMADMTKEEHAVVTLKTEAAKSDMITKFCNNIGITPNILFESAWGIVLQKLIGTSDVLFGRVVSGRNLDVVNLENSVGLFINTVPVRIGLNSEETITEILTKNYNHSIESMRYEHYPLSVIQKQSAIGGDLIHSLVAFEVLADEKHTSGKLGLKRIHTREQTNYPITLNITKTETFSFQVMYDTVFYGEEECNRILDKFLYIVNEIMADPDVQLKDLNCITQQEKQLLLSEFNQTKTDYPADKSVTEIFNENVKRYPDRIAVRQANESLTYKQLDCHACKIAAALATRGVQKNDIVGIAAERKWQVLAGFLGILKCGAVYLPLDIKNPAKRQEYILDDCNCRCILDLYGSLDLGEYSGNVIGETDIVENNYVAEVLNKATDLAYVIYTSGTTGEPKGAMIEHRSIVRLVKNTNYIPFDEIRVLQTGALTFDACTFEIWGPLLNGGMVCIGEQEVLADTKLLGEKINTYGINSMFITTALFNQIVDCDARVLGKLNYLLVGGERMSRGPAEAFRRENPHVKFSNIYGPTECTTFALVQQLGDKIPDVIPIGTPISNTTAYVLGKDNQLCGIGMPGELCIGGPGVARGYLGMEQLTNEKFVKNPYVDGERIYRTGDLARWLGNGSIDYLGRIDDQIKIRGFRIELGEIANAIKNMNEVTDVAVVVQQNGDEKIICAYLQLSKKIEMQEIKARLAKKLPYYMIPAYMKYLEKLPVNKNGKIDKGRLPVPNFESEKTYVEPQTKMQKQIRDIFVDILHVEQIGIEDDFFALGGHSIKVIRLAGMIEKEFGRRLAISELMKKKTVKEIAAELEGSRNNLAFQSIQKASDNEMSSVQKRIYALEQLSRGTSAYNIPILLQVNGAIDLCKMQEAIDQVCGRHEILRTCFCQDEDKLLQVVCEDVDVTLVDMEVDVADIGMTIKKLVQPFSLKELPLLRAYILRNKFDSSTWLFFDVHHIIMDGASVPIFIEELCRLYNNEKLEEVRLQYVDYSAWHNGMDKKKQEEYWLKQLSGEEFHTHLREDFTRPASQTYCGDSFIMELGDELYGKVRALGQSIGATEYMVFLAAVSILLSRYSRQDKVFIGTAVSGRSHIDIQEMIGMFVNTIVIKNEVNVEISFDTLVRNTMKICAEAFEHQDYPFEKLVEKLGVERSSSRNPIFDILFTLEIEDGRRYRLGESTLTVYEIPNYTAKFDLVINVKLTRAGCKIAWEYNKALFKRDSVQRMAGHYKAILQQCVGRPKDSLEKIENMDSRERALVTETFGKGRRSKPYGGSIIELFEEQVRRHPNKAAARIGGEQITYDKLNKKANGLGNELRTRGIGRGDIVALECIRSLEMLVGMIGTLKAGAAYVPIDPGYPKERKRFILEDSGAKVVLVYETDNRQQISGLEKTIDLSVIKEVNDNLQRITEESDTAYVIYTSGTTGTPKGVPIQNRNLINLMSWQIKEAEIDKDSVILQKSTYTFDASVWEIFLGLLSGATLQMLTEEENRDYHSILKVMNKGKVTHTLMIPTVFETLLDYMTEGDNSMAHLKRLYLGAEILQYNLLEKYTGITGNRLEDVRNLYGPTEGTVCATCHALRNQDKGRKIPIGKPIDNTDIYIIQDGYLCGIGMIGELCIGGMGISSGYMNQRKLTEEKFISAPFDRNVRIYKTGDLAVWREDGTIEYVERADDQVKIRGFRVELDEISARCLKIGGIHNAATVIFKTDHNTHICCYVVKDKHLNIQEIERELRATLPDYMIPTCINAVEKIPFTANGKLDKKALPQPQLENTAVYIAPENETERMLASIFSEILDVKKVGRTDSFFALGGHSIKAANLVRMIEKRMGVRITIKDVMVEQDISHIAILINEKEKNPNNDKKYVPLMKATSI